MIEIDIPGYRRLRLEHCVMDVNGTLALDGTLLDGVAPLLAQLAQSLKLHMLTADTHGKQAGIDAALGFKARIIAQGGREKTDYVGELGEDSVVAIGNGANDSGMCELAALSMAVIGPEGASSILVRSADIVTRDIRDALGLLLNPDRLRATLRR